jgi:hypothetical protein
VDASLVSILFGSVGIISAVASSIVPNALREHNERRRHELLLAQQVTMRASSQSQDANPKMPAYAEQKGKRSADRLAAKSKLAFPTFTLPAFTFSASKLFARKQDPKPARATEKSTVAETAEITRAASKPTLRERMLERMKQSQHMKSRPTVEQTADFSAPPDHAPAEEVPLFHDDAILPDPRGANEMNASPAHEDAPIQEESHEALPPIVSEKPSSGPTRSPVHFSLSVDSDEDDGFVSWSRPLVDTPTETSPPGTISYNIGSAEYGPTHEMDRIDSPTSTPEPTVSLPIGSDTDSVETPPAAVVPMWTIPFVGVPIENADERARLIDDIVVLGDDLTPGTLATIYTEDATLRSVLLSAISDFGSSQAMDVYQVAIHDIDPQLVTMAFDALVARQQYELASHALRHVEIAPYVVMRLREYLPDIMDRLRAALPEGEVAKVNEMLSYA